MAPAAAGSPLNPAADDTDAHQLMLLQLLQCHIIVKVCIGVAVINFLRMSPLPNCYSPSAGIRLGCQ